MMHLDTANISLVKANSMPVFIADTVDYLEDQAFSLSIVRISIADLIISALIGVYY